MAEIEEDPAPARRVLADYGLAKVVMTALGDSGDMVVTVRILPAADARRIMNDLVNSSASLG
jgi:hypothetical protein